MGEWLERARLGAAIVSFAAAGGLGAWVIAEPSPSIAKAAAPPAEVRVGDRALPERVTTASYVARLAEEWDGQRFTLEVPGQDPIVRSRAALGAHLDRSALRSRLGQAIDSTSPMRRYHAAENGTRPLEVPLPMALDESRMFEVLANLKDGYDRRPRDARANPRTGEILAHQDGRQLDVHGTLEAIREALEEGRSTVRATVREQAARRSESDLEGLDLSAVLGSYETRYSTTAEAADRTYNLRVAAEKIDGLVVLPGETFDFNEAVGERSEANGFRPATVIAGGELTDGVGGGTCQVAGSLHSAVFFAGLPIEERAPHSRPSSYIFMGLDAVVSYPQLNFRFRNDLDFPVAIGFTVEGGIARAEIRGAELQRLVSLVRRVDDIVAYGEREVRDESLPAGVRVLRQRGVPGFRVTHWRIVRDLETNQARRTHGNDVYPPTQQVWRVGSGAPAPEGYTAPEGDTHGEYTADAYLEVTQGQGVSGTQIIRRAGRSGTYGWTARMGFPQPE